MQSGGGVGSAADVDKAIGDLRAAQKSGNFAAQGDALQALDEAMTRFKNAQSAGGSTPAVMKADEFAGRVAQVARAASTDDAS